MRTARELLVETFECSDTAQDLQLAITLNPSLNRIINTITLAQKEAFEEAIIKAINPPFSSGDYKQYRGVTYISRDYIIGLLK